MTFKVDDKIYFRFVIYMRHLWYFTCHHGLLQEAKELWKKIQQRQGVNKWRPDLEEEYEDKEGNIYNKKTYTDLQRQGLI